MLAIRLRRAGSKGRPFFRVVVTESRSAREGRFVEVLGSYNPRTTPERLDVDRERLAHWISSGARPSNTVRTLVDRMPPAPPAAEAASESGAAPKGAESAGTPEAR
jgi:small subunit ribosomal protein S16